MIRGIGGLRLSTYSQTLNVQKTLFSLAARQDNKELRHQVGLLR